ncbi:MAG: hypothetical protein ACPGR8_13075 [Limisphaerales bacterium]
MLLIGHADHVEVQGTMGEAPERMIVVERGYRKTDYAVEF